MNFLVLYVGFAGTIDFPQLHRLGLGRSLTLLALMPCGGNR